jgi:hypothetical protein
LQSVSLLTVDQRIPPVRGLVLSHNAQGAPLDLVDLKRWVRLNCDVFKTQKIDLFLLGFDPNVLPLLLEQAVLLNVRLSLRTDCSAGPETLRSLTDAGVFDVFLTPRSADLEHLTAWFQVCQEAALPMRLQLQAPFPPAFDVEHTADRVAAAGVVAVNVTASDPFLKAPGCRDAQHSRETVDQMNALVAALDARGLEVNLLHLPFCLVTPENWAFAVNSQQFYLDHQQYHKLSYDLAAKIFPCGPNEAGKAILIPLGRHSAATWLLDQKLLPWIVGSPWLHLRLLAWRKLTRRLRAVWGKPKGLPETETAYLREIERTRKRQDAILGPACSQCSLRRICDHESEEFKRRMPGLSVSPQPGEVVAAPLRFSSKQRKYYDPIDVDRVRFAERYLALANRANDIVTNTTPTREVDSFEYKIEGQYTHQMPGGTRWYSFTNSEKLSTALARVAVPVTLSVTFGGGVADYIGFSFGRHCKLLCPMETYSHRLVLHVDAEGHYVLMRDGIPVRPMEFEGVQYVPARLAGVLEPRICIWNIDGAIVTQAVLLWESRQELTAELSRIKYSVMIVSTRYSRRLQVVLQCLAHQRDVDLDKLEVILSYVPGIDATDDVIESMKLLHPRLRIVRAPFAEGNTKSKGFLINESVRVASGEWIVLLDSDILIAPDMFAKMESAADTAYFLCPDGRKMLTPRDTAKILLGEVRPWEQWEELLQSEGEFRPREADGVPIGFFQAVRKTCLDKVPYMEMDHFEGADWFFGYSMRKMFGEETRLTGTPVLHLDHGGSQWYGTHKQR